MRDNMKRHLNKKGKLLTGFLFVVLISVGLFTGYKFFEKIQIPEALRASRNDAKEAQVERYKQDSGVVAIFYPEFESEELNQKINEVKEEIKAELAIQPDEEVKVDYTLKNINDTYISVLFDVTNNQNSDVIYYSRLFDAKTFEDIPLDNLFDQALLRKVSSKLRTQLKKMESMANTAYTLDFYEATSSSAEHFDTFLLTEERIDFVFSSNTYGNHPSLILSFDLSSVASSIALDLNGVENRDGVLEFNDRYVDPNRPMIAITFDDGPVKKYMPRLIEAFEHYGQAATFFMVGNRIPGNEALIRELVINGNEASSHSYSHPNLNKLSGEKLDFELNETARLISEATYGCYTMKTYRAPYGNSNDQVKAASNYPFIHWSIDTLDWKTRDTQSNIDAIMNHVEDGDIILMHELYETSVEAVETVIPLLIEQGYQLVTVSEMMEAKGIQMQAGQVYHSAK